MDTEGEVVLGRAVVIGGAVVCLAAIAVTQLDLPEDAPAALAEFSFGLLETDLACFVLPAAYFRFAVPAHPGEALWARSAMALAVGAAAHGNLLLKAQGQATSLELLFAALAASYAACCGCTQSLAARVALAAMAAGVVAAALSQGRVNEAGRAALGLGSALLLDSLVGAKRNGATRGCVAAAAGAAGALLLPAAIFATACFLLPVEELAEAYDLVSGFVGSDKMRALSANLLVATIFCQVSLGYLGIAFMRAGQERKNALVAVGEGHSSARGYAWFILWYMATAALPYIVQRTVIENVNWYIYGHFTKELERELRIATLFPQGAVAGAGDTLLAAVHGSDNTVESYTDAFNDIIEVGYEVVERKLFALPNLLLLPGMLMQQPWLVVAVLPASMALDVARANFVGVMTKRIEKMSRDIQKLSQRRRKVEQHDTRHEELVRRSAASEFAESQWRELAMEIEAVSLRYRALVSLRRFVNALYWQDFLLPGVELVIAWLLEVGHITSSDILVYTRVLEDTIDFLLTRFRMDATLASMDTNMKRVQDLSSRLDAVRDRGRAHCSVDEVGGEWRVSGLRYSRGSSVNVSIPQLILRSGRVYAVTGPNGCGKSSLFGVLASCGEHAATLPEGLQIQGSDDIVLPSSDVVELTQQLYCPYYVRPLSWLIQRRQLEEFEPEDLQRQEQRVQQLFDELEFYRRDDSSSGGQQVAEGFDAAALREDTEDWYSTLSGGQRCKAEFIRKVFLRERCPGVLLIDEAFAPLDPASKLLVQRKLKEFCSRSLVLVIYHAGASEHCVVGGGFFDEALDFADGTARLVPTC